MLPDVLEVEHHAHDVVPVLRDAHLLEQAVADGEGALGEVRVEPGADEVHPEPVGAIGAVGLDLDLALEVDDDTRRRLAAPGAQVEDARETRRRRLGQRARGLALAQQRLGPGGPFSLGVGLEVCARRLDHLAAVAALAGHFDREPERVVAQAARGVLHHQRAVGRERVVAVLPGLEALGHLAVERAGGEQRVVAVAGAGIARDHLAVAHHDGFPLRALRHPLRRRPQPRLGRLRLGVERCVRPRARYRGRARRGLSRAALLGGAGGGRRHERRGGGQGEPREGPAD